MNETDRELLVAAFEAVKDNCGRITYIRKAAGEYDPGTRLAGQAPEPMEVYALTQGGRNFYDKGGAVVASDMQVTIPAVQLDFTPEPNDEVMVNGADYIVAKVGQVMGLSPGVAIMHELQVRHG